MMAQEFFVPKLDFVPFRCTCSQCDTTPVHSYTLATIRCTEFTRVLIRLLGTLCFALVACTTGPTARRVQSICSAYTHLRVHPHNT